MKKLPEVFLKTLGLLLALIVFIGFIFDSGLIGVDKINPYPDQVKYGVTFSPRYAKYLKLDWQKTYLQMLDDLKVKNIRIPTYWDIMQPVPQKYDFSETDYMLDEAGKRNVKVVLVLGMRQPRWPECQIPAWAKGLSVNSRQQQVLELIANTVQRYKQSLPSPNGERKNPVVAWQVENEPFVSWFGQNCDPPDEKFLREEVKMVKKLDSARPVIITDSGEWSNWISVMKLSDILGISVYRKTFNQFLNSYITYPFPSWMYPLKSGLVRKLFALQNQKTIISELQTEPWFQKGVLEMPVEEQLALFTPRELKANVEYAKRTGMGEQYLWGAEWWYFMAAHGHPEYLEYAKTLFR